MPEITKIPQSLLEVDIQAVVDANKPLVYTSGLQSWAAGGTYNFTHGLGGVPDIFQVYAECISSTLGYSTGDRILIDQVQNGASNFTNVAPRANATTVTVVVSANGILAQSSTLLNSNFRLRVKAVRFV